MATASCHGKSSASIPDIGRRRRSGALVKRTGQRATLPATDHNRIEGGIAVADEHTGEQGSVGKQLKRRGILAAAGAVVAGIVAKQASESVGAASGGGDQGF